MRNTICGRCKAPIRRWTADYTHQGVPLVVVRNRDRDPPLFSLLVLTSICAMWCELLRAVALRAKHSPAREIVNQCGSQIVQRRLVLRHVDVLALTGSAS